MMVYRALALAVVLQLGLGGFAQAQQRKVEMPKPEILTLTTKDRLPIKATYYAGGVQTTDGANKKIDNKKVVPVILIHDLDGQRAEFEGFALALQSLGHAVIVPDLRGHGESAGSDLDVKRMNKRHFEAMILDLAACKSFLLDANNKGELNIEMLTLVGCGLGASVAAHYAVYDWSLPQLPTYRQGRDVKAVVMISPERSVKGYTINAPLNAGVLKSEAIAVMLIVGRRDSSRADVAKFHKIMESGRPELTDDKERRERQSLYLFEPDTSLRSTKLLYARGLRPSPATLVADFIRLRLTDRADFFPWQERRSPLSDDG